MTHPAKRLLLFTAKLGYQTRSFEDAARKLGVQACLCYRSMPPLEDPWGDQAIAVHFESPEVAAYTVMEALRGQDVGGFLLSAIGPPPLPLMPLVARESVTTIRRRGSLPQQAAHERSLSRCRTQCPMVRIFPLIPARARTPGISYPCVLKPLSLSASQGVVRADNREEFLAAAARVRRLLKSRRYLPLASRISIRCLWKDTFLARK